MCHREEERSFPSPESIMRGVDSAPRTPTPPNMQVTCAVGRASAPASRQLNRTMWNATGPQIQSSSASALPVLWDPPIQPASAMAGTSKKVLILGAGLVCAPGVKYLASKGCEVTVASRTVSKCEDIVKVLHRAHDPTSLLQHSSPTPRPPGRRLRPALCSCPPLMTTALLRLRGCARWCGSQGLAGCKAVELDALDASQQAKLEAMVTEVDIVVSLLPWTMHTWVYLFATPVLSDGAF